MAASSEVIEAPSASSAEVARAISPLRLVLVVAIEAVNVASTPSARLVSAVTEALEL